MFTPSCSVNSRRSNWIQSKQSFVGKKSVGNFSPAFFKHFKSGDHVFVTVDSKKRFFHSPPTSLVPFHRPLAALPKTRRKSNNRIDSKEIIKLLKGPQFGFQNEILIDNFFVEKLASDRWCCHQKIIKNKNLQCLWQLLTASPVWRKNWSRQRPISKTWMRTSSVSTENKSPLGEKNP